MILVEKKFESYEGEGRLIGTKTLFFTYSLDSKTTLKEEDINKLNNIYICSDIIDDKLINFINTYKNFKTITLDIDAILYNENLPKCNYFLKSKCRKDLNIKNKELISIKVEIDNPSNFKNMVDVANYYADLNYDVYLMPMFINEVGIYMSEYFNIINNKVKTMPPTQLLIDIN